VTGPGSELSGFLGDYLMLVSLLDRLVPGLADARCADPDIGRRLAAEPVPRPSDLVRRAGRLARQLPDLPLEAGRRDFLARQLLALETTARRLTGQSVPFGRELRDCFDVAPRLGSPDDYAAAHADLDTLLAGPGPLASRLAGYRRAQEVPAAGIEAALAALSELLRGRSAALVPLPPGERVVYRVVPDAPWSALHEYRGRYRSRVTVNAGARLRGAQLAQLVAHEAYPGHHVERCRKEAGLVARGWVEHGVQVANSPQSLIAEGAAELGLGAVLGPGWGPVVAEALAGLGLDLDGELVERVDAVTARLVRVRQDAALLLHDRRRPAEDVLAYLCRWLMVDPPRARQMLRFLRHPVWRAYTTTYVEGPALLRPWWALDPGPARLRRLLDEPLTPDAVRAELTS
jgi:hypothetical protein